MENRRNDSVAVGAATEKPKSNTQAQDNQHKKYTPNFSDDQKNKNSHQFKSNNTTNNGAEQLPNGSDDNWLADTVSMLIEQGHRPIPMHQIGNPMQFGDAQRYPSNDQAWSKAKTDIVSVALDDFILLDFDGNKKDKEVIPLEELLSIVGGEPLLVQHNVDSDSLHYFYKIPDHVDKESLKHSNDNWLPGVDVKTKNQLIHIKKGKLLIDNELPKKNEVPDAPQCIIDALTIVTPEFKAKRLDNRTSATKAKEILGYIRPDCDYSIWIKIGMGLHDEFNGSEQGLALWDHWSMGANNYAGKTLINNKWQSFGKNTANPTRFATVCHMAKQAGADLAAIAKKYDKDGNLKLVYSDVIKQVEVLTPESEPEQVHAILDLVKSLSSIEQGKILKSVKNNTEISLGDLKRALKETEEPKDQLDLAKHVIDNYDPQNILVSLGCVWAWNNTGVWSKLEDRSLKQKVQNVLNEYTDPVTRPLVDGVSELIKNQVHKPDHEFDIAGTESVNCLNGELVLDEFLDSWILEEHKREHYRTSQIPIEYDEQAKAPQFLKFMSDVFSGDDDKDDKIQAILEMMGYSLMAHCRHEKFVILIGTGANGKSVLLSILEALCGFKNVAGVQPSKFASPFQRGHLFGKLTNIVTETEQGQIIDDAALKAITTGELTTVENKYQDPFEIKPFATCWFGTNHMPHTKDFSDALFRRALVVKFNNTFKPELGNCDPLLKEKLLSELQGILTLSLNSYAEAVAKGFTVPESSKIARQEWRKEADQAVQFIDECTENDEHGIVSKRELFKCYQWWAEENGIKKTLSQKGLRERLIRLEYQEDRDKKNRYFKGLKLIKTPYF
jgi:P4 family phage/plasmid primase-like protien